MGKAVSKRESDNVQFMDSKVFLESLAQSIEKQIDFFIIRTTDGSLRQQIDLSNKDKTLLSKQMWDWVETFRNSNESCSIKNFSDEKGSIHELIIERANGKPSIFIFGAGHVGQALALTSILLGYEVVVIDDRAEFASRNRLPDPRIRLVVDDFDKAIKSLNIGARSAAVIVTRGHQFDEICLENLLRLQISYLGMIGSRRRVISIFKRLSQRGFADVDLSKVHAPIGLSIGARSPQEIAIAILAEIIAEANKVGTSR